MTPTNTELESIEQKLKDVAEKVVNPEQTDASFMSNLQDLCVLNKLAESHREYDTQRT